MLLCSGMLAFTLRLAARIRQLKALARFDLDQSIVIAGTVNKQIAGQAGSLWQAHG
jgi:hypothetical protein